ncbi:TRAP transporter substrate-binding protein DctP [Vibrio splendidus]|uniref:TRAP transporter substrate-binding protein n=1 Tax=Vibrio splendidus TaxID=29497 RepID=UPI00021C202A|nr:TRAP transporter substrate-binding protein DctP [Vibrio splendidus]EGU43080.1 TRAP dicarboxylate transporter, DctP subunit, putative [Vibrio splendidus ATCC 33789]|tara:strand:+ start:4801 stop:5790 length:990 start_codon:yes stop_codon:yes gene_type:complete
MKNSIKLASLVIGGLLSFNAMSKEVIRLSTYVNESDIRYEGFKKFAEIAEEKSNGNLKVRIYPSSTLHGWSEGVDAVQGGVADISWISADNRLSCYRTTSLYPSAVDLSGQLAMDSKYRELITPEANKNGLVPLMNSNYSYDQEWWFNKQVNSVEEFSNLNGKLVRSVGPLVSQMIEGWGGKPVFISPKEVFQSAERGVVDGINMGVATYSSWKLWNVMPHMVDAGIFYGNIMYMMNKDRFDSLSKADQKALMEAAQETEAWLKPKYEQWVDERIAEAKQAGGTVLELTSEQKLKLVSDISSSWEGELTKDCGAPLSVKMKDLFAANSI